MDLDNKEIHDTSKLASDKEKAAKEIFYGHIVPLAQESFEHDGGISPMIFFFLDDGSDDKVAIAPMPAGMFMESDDKKEVLAEMLKEFTNELDIVGIGMFAEAWATKMDEGKATEKSEIIFYSFESENTVYMKRDTVNRNEKKPTLIHGRLEQDQSYSGRFVGFLKDMKKTKLN